MKAELMTLDELKKGRGMSLKAELITLDELKKGRGPDKVPRKKRVTIGELKHIDPILE